jgi:hypothetical protein
MEQNNPESHLNNWQNPWNNYGSTSQGLILLHITMLQIAIHYMIND